MGAVFTLLMFLIIIICILLIIIVMAQNPKGGGLSSTFGGASQVQFGVQRTNDFMEKATWTLGATVVVLIIFSMVITGEPEKTKVKPSVPKKEQTTSSKPNTTTTTPASGALPASK